MTYTIAFVDKITDRDALAEITHRYYSFMVPKLVAMGGPNFNPDDLVADTLREISGFLPPSGRVALAHDAAGRLVGCGMMRTCAPGAVELKRLFVLPECQGSGLGRRLVEARLEEARGMGMTHAYADAFKNNIPMQKLYETLGFEPCERYEGIDEYDELTEFMIFRRLTL